MYNSTTRERILELLPTCNNAEIARRTGASMTGIQAIRKTLKIANPYFKGVRRMVQQRAEQPATKFHVPKIDPKTWPCGHTIAEWRGCDHHRECQAGHRCEAPGK